MLITKNKSEEQENNFAGKINSFLCRFEITKIPEESNIKNIRCIVRINNIDFGKNSSLDILVRDLKTPNRHRCLFY